MASFPNAGRIYQNIHSTDNSRMHLGDVYNNHGSPDERALKAILDSLSYPGMKDRRDALAEAHEKTFDWTFLEGKTNFLEERDKYGNEKWDRYETVDMNFRSWLQQEDQGLFYVTGKPGSGKSTFMKTLATNSEVTTMLQAWAADAVLLRSDHFFWLLGEPMQKSVQGLLRCMLHSVLLGLSQYDMSKNIGAIRHICGPRWQSTTANGAWSSRELKHMLTRLSGVSRVKSFFLIDALDEYEPQDHLGDLANEIWWLSQLPNVKLCVSCRPWEVFTRKFGSNVSLRLEQLTRRDMETYVGARLIAAEEERGWDSEFRDKTHAAELLIQNVARSAEGVFLWTELVVTAMCSEIRKGSRVERLSHIISDFPSDLDEYFHRLIFDRIGRSRRNVEDTAAALKLAIIVHASTQKGGTGFPESHPLADSYVNFWLMINGHLSPGFSWTDSEGIFQPSALQMLDQTAGYLEETCKDLLVLKHKKQSVGFLHRTVFDFLPDNKPHETLVQKAPNHFSGEDFIFNLAKLRSVCLLRTQHADCNELASELYEILGKYEHLTHLDQHVAWLSKIESVTISQIRETNRLSHWTHPYVLEYGMLHHCVKAGLNRFLLEFYKHLPASALGDSYEGGNFLCNYLYATMQSDIREPDLSLLQRFLNLGCDPNRSVARWPYIWYERYPFCTQEEFLENKDMPSCCARTVWTAWLGETFIQLAKITSVTSETEPDETLIRRKRQVADMILLLLQHGADPRCMVCVTDHWEKSDTKCHLVTLDGLVEAFVPTVSLTKLRNLRELCSNRATSYALRRNQRRRAVNSFQVSEQFCKRLAKEYWSKHPQMHRSDENTSLDLDFLVENMAHLAHGVCNACTQPTLAPILVIWCLDCGDLSMICCSCFVRNPFEVLGLETSCGGCTGDYDTSVGKHTSVTWLCEERYHEFCKGKVPEGHTESLLLRYSIAQAISIMKEWYAKDPIEPDLSFEDVLRKTRMTSLQPSHQTQEPGTIIVEVPTEQGGRSTRPWLL